MVYRFKGGQNGNAPEAGLLDVSGTLYGTTAGQYYKGATVFAVSTSGKERVLHSFGSGDDGDTPHASLIDVNGTLYGTTYYGGDATYCGSCGIVFSVGTTGKERVLHSFQGDYSGDTDGANPDASLIDVDGTLYGTTHEGGAHGYSSSGYGTVFSVSTTGTERAVYSFKGGSDGAFPYASLIDVKGTLYGTTSGRGDLKCSYTYGGCGTVFSVSTTGTERVLHRFKGGSDGANSWPGIGGSLIDLNGTLYGTTEFGGVGKCQGYIPGCGTVFSISTSGAEKVLYAFQGGSDGAGPGAGLIAVKNTLYGTTSFGGANNLGTVFSMTTSGKEAVIYSFSGGSDGAVPFASLIDVNGTLYGTTVAGGGQGCSASTGARTDTAYAGCGTVFKVKP